MFFGKKIVYHFVQLATFDIGWVPDLIQFMYIWIYVHVYCVGQNKYDIISYSLSRLAAWMPNADNSALKT
jgi:hypothetical protein